MRKTDEYARSPLHYVCIDLPKEERVIATNKMIDGGEDINAQDKNGWSPLHFAAQEGDTEIAEILINAGADINLKDTNGNTPLWVATMNSHYGTEVINLLLTHGADSSQKNNHGISPVEISPELFGNAT
jgi:ankyrin repeat protein